MSEPPQSDPAPVPLGPNLRKRYWDSRFAVTVIILVLLACIAAYLQYVYYPSVLLAGQFGETNISLHLSFLTFQVDATRGAEFVPGIPSLDFLQIFVVVLVLLNLSRFLETRKGRSRSRESSNPN